MPTADPYAMQKPWSYCTLTANGSGVFIFIANPTTFCVSVKLFPKHPELHVVIHFLTESKVQHVDPYGTNNFITINWSAHQSMSKINRSSTAFSGNSLYQGVSILRFWTENISSKSEGCFDLVKGKVKIVRVIWNLQTGNTYAFESYGNLEFQLVFRIKINIPGIKLIKK